MRNHTFHLDIKDSSGKSARHYFRVSCDSAEDSHNLGRSINYITSYLQNPYYPTSPVEGQKDAISDLAELSGARFKDVLAHYDISDWWFHTAITCMRLGASSSIFLVIGLLLLGANPFSAAVVAGAVAFVAALAGIAMLCIAIFEKVCGNKKNKQCSILPEEQIIDFSVFKEKSGAVITEKKKREGVVEQEEAAEVKRRAAIGRVCGFIGMPYHEAKDKGVLACGEKKPTFTKLGRSPPSRG